MPLIVKPIEAIITTDKDTFGKSDPYCVITIGNEKQKTRTCGGGGKRPNWSDTLSFTSTDQLLRVAVWDDDTFSDDMIGEGTLNLVQFYQNPGRTENEWVDLIHKGKPAGRIQLSVELQGQGNQSWGNQGGYNQGGFNQGGYNQGPPQNQWGGNQGGYNQGGYNQGPPQNQWGGNQGGYGQGQGGYNQGGYNQGPPQNQWGGNQGGRGGGW